MPKVLLLNAIIPGAGLVVLRREWLGLANSILFAVFALIFIFSRWITPSDIPAWASYLSLAGVIVVWIGSLVFVVQHGRVVSDPDFISEMNICGRKAKPRSKRATYRKHTASCSWL